jgi:hypothetical protein
MKDNEEEEDDDNYHEFSEYCDTLMGEAEGEAEGEAHDEPRDDLGRTIADAQRECETNKESSGGSKGWPGWCLDHPEISTEPIYHRKKIKIDIIK